jgi:hypothetical protein
MTTAARREAPTFLLQYQERHVPAENQPTILCATQTRTATIEGSDQDPRSLAPVLMATRTATQTIESSDQDAQILAATASQTFTIEEPDQDPSPRSYYAFPRAECSSS